MSGDETVGTFTLTEANALLPDVLALTEKARAQLEACRYPWETLGFRKFNVLAELPEEEHVRLRWAAAVVRLGAIPKRYFAVDFQSPDPAMVYCWTWGETKVAFQHGKTEACNQRRPVET